MDKLQHWRGFQVKNAWNTAPILEFAYFLGGAEKAPASFMAATRASL